MYLPSISNELFNAVETHSETHASQKATAKSQNDDDVLSADVEIIFPIYLKRKKKQIILSMNHFF